MSLARFCLEASTRSSSSGDVIPTPDENIGAASKKAGFNGSSDNYSDRLLGKYDRRNFGMVGMISRLHPR